MIGTPERVSEPASPKGKPDLRVSCRSLGEADHEGWLSKKGTRSHHAGSSISLIRVTAVIEKSRDWKEKRQGKSHFF